MTEEQAERLIAVLVKIAESLESIEKNLDFMSTQEQGPQPGPGSR